jgi:hypothetical protein
MFNWIKKLFSKKQESEPVHIYHAWICDEEMKRLLEPKISILETASDVSELHVHFDSLPMDEKIRLFILLFKWMAYYESAWNPNSQSVDVGEKSDRDTWSIGLLQLSVVDQKNLGIPMGYNFDDLLLPVPNLKLGIEIMCNQVKKRGKIFIPKWEHGNPALYWATICPGGKYDQSEAILKRVRSE